MHDMWPRWKIWTGKQQRWEGFHFIKLIRTSHILFPSSNNYGPSQLIFTHCKQHSLDIFFKFGIVWNKACALFLAATHHSINGVSSLLTSLWTVLAGGNREIKMADLQPEFYKLQSPTPKNNAQTIKQAKCVPWKHKNRLICCYFVIINFPSPSLYPLLQFLWHIALASCLFSNITQKMSLTS